MALLTILKELGLLSENIELDASDFSFRKVRSYTKLNALQNGSDEYSVMIEKDGCNWVVFAEDHEPKDLEALGIKANHKTLKGAKKSAIEFAIWFQTCTWEVEIECDEDW